MRNRTYSPADTASRLFALAVPLVLALALAGCRIQADTSFTTHKPHCASGQTAQRMPNHQHYMWTCAPGGPAS
jgi:hypothetical protein